MESQCELMICLCNGTRTYSRASPLNRLLLSRFSRPWEISNGAENEDRIGQFFSVLLTRITPPKNRNVSCAKVLFVGGGAEWEMLAAENCIWQKLLSNDKKVGRGRPPLRSSSSEPLLARERDLKGEQRADERIRRRARWISWAR